MNRFMIGSAVVVTALGLCLLYPHVPVFDERRLGRAAAPLDRYLAVGPSVPEIN